MDLSRLKGSVRRVTVLQKESSGEVTPVTIYRAKSAKRKRTLLLRPFEKAVRRLAEANQAVAASYVARHEKSNEQKRDGWLRDMPENTMKASKQGAKRIRALILP